jgi:hypothetical protein
MNNSKTFIKTQEQYEKALELYRILWLNSNNFSTIKAKASLMEIIEQYERMNLKNDNILIKN